MESNTPKPSPAQGTGWLHPQIVIAIIGLFGASLGLFAAFISMGWIDRQSVPWWPWRPQSAVLYAVDWSRDFDGWQVPDNWQVDSGSLWNHPPADLDFWDCPANWLAAPWDAGTTSNYALEATLSVNRPFSVMFGQQDPQFVAALVVRSGYYIYIGMVDPPGAAGLTPGVQLEVRDETGDYVLDTNVPLAVEGDPHTYRVEVNEEKIGVWLDNNPVMSAEDGSHQSGGKVGLWCANAQLTVDAFRVMSI